MKVKIKKKRSFAAAAGAAVGTIAEILILFLAGLATAAYFWCFRTWPALTANELVYHMTANLDGTGSQIILSGGLQVGIPAALWLLFLIAVIGIRGKRQKRKFRISLAAVIAAMAVIAGEAYSFSSRIELGTYLRAQNSESSFIDDNYVYPSTVEMTFPEKKRNLIYIYLESMETTFSDLENGGGFKENYIPELTQIAQENEDFSGDTEALNGGISYSKTNYTMGAIFAQSLAIPLQTLALNNTMDTQENFYADAVGLGDVLQKNGYRQIFLCGSEAVFGGRELFFTDHGNFEIRDYNRAVQQGKIPSDYYRWWGYEDEKLFTYAKEAVQELSDGEEPFNLTILTVDTHFEDGYVCDRCPNTFGSNQYANVLACSSAQVAEFVEWLKTQDCYENTTIILTGDHKTMDTDFCDDMADQGYNRKAYLSIINSAVEPEDPSHRREFSTIDMFPTTLAAMGVRIKGNRLGLGTNLFSEEKTLTEIFGADTMNTELDNYSELLDELGKVEITEGLAQKTYDNLQVAMKKKLNSLQFMVEGADYYDGSEKKITAYMDPIDDPAELEVLETDHLLLDNGEEIPTIGERTIKRESKKTDDGYSVSLKISSVDTEYLNVRLYSESANGEKYLIYDHCYSTGLYKSTGLDTYLKALEKMTDVDIFIAVKDDASTSLTRENVRNMKALGLNKDLSGKFRQSYIAAITEDGIVEKLSGERITETFTLSDGTECTLTSLGDPGEIEDASTAEAAAEDEEGKGEDNSQKTSAENAEGSESSENSSALSTGETPRETVVASILLNDTEYAKNERGLNIVVRSRISGEVIDSVYVDTYENDKIMR